MWDSRLPKDERMKNKVLSENEAAEIIKEIENRLMEIEPLGDRKT